MQKHNSKGKLPPSARGLAAVYPCSGGDNRRCRQEEQPLPMVRTARAGSELPGWGRTWLHREVLPTTPGMAASPPGLPLPPALPWRYFWAILPPSNIGFP